MSLTTMVRVVVVEPPGPVAVTVNVADGEMVVGVPAITPLTLLMLSPVGSAGTTLKLVTVPATLGLKAVMPCMTTNAGGAG
jgi:hypothetical protein